MAVVVVVEKTGGERERLAMRLSASLAVASQLVAVVVVVHDHVIVVVDTVGAMGGRVDDRGVRGERMLVEPDRIGGRDHEELGGGRGAARVELVGAQL